MKLSKKIVVVLAVLVLAITGTAMVIPLETGKTGQDNTTVLRFDVAEDATRFVFDESPVFEDGAPAYGNSFVTNGYIYEPGTLNASDGVLSDGSPEFPDKVIGSWICRGWFIGDGARTTSGAWVVTNQYYQFGEEAGLQTIVTDGVEIAEVNQPVYRAITGGTGKYSNARGQGTQQLLGFNQGEGVNLRFELEIVTNP